MTAPAPAEAPAPESVPVASSESAPGFEADQLVSYEHPDPVSGQTLEGIGVVLEVRLEDGSVREGGAVRVAPLADPYIEVAPEHVTGARTRGKRVGYAYFDAITGAVLTGDAVVILAGKEKVTLSPVLVDRFLEVAPERLSAVSVPTE